MSVPSNIFSCFSLYETFFSMPMSLTGLLTMLKVGRIPSHSRSLFTDLIHRMHELDSNLIDQEG